MTNIPEESRVLESGQSESTHTRRELIRILFGAATVVSAASVGLWPGEAKAGADLDYTQGLRGPYAEVVNRYRRLFGRRQYYQLGFEAAMGRPDHMVVLPNGLYGVLPESFNPRNPRAINPGTEFPVEAAAYLQAIQPLEKTEHQSLNAAWLQAKAALGGRIREIVFGRYGEYDSDLFSRVGIPVVTLNNLDQKQLEMFFRFPLPGTMEYFQMATGSWADYYDQSKLRHNAPFMALYNPGLSLFQNLINVYGPGMQAFSAATQAVKNKVAGFIKFTNNQIKNRFGAQFGLSPSQKDTLNQWLGVKNTPYEIR